MNTENSIKINFSGLVNQIIIFEEYAEHYEKYLKPVKKKSLIEKKQIGDKKSKIEKNKNENEGLLLTTKLIERMIIQNTFEEVIKGIYFFI